MFQVTHKTIDELHLQNRTSAYRWLWRNYEAITVRRGFWLGLADKLASEGIVRTDRDGRMVPYDPEALRQTFNRVKADKAMTGMPGRKTSRQTSRQKKAAADHPAVSPAVPVIPTDADTPSGVTFTRTPGRLAT